MLFQRPTFSHLSQRGLAVSLLALSISAHASYAPAPSASGVDLIVPAQVSAEGQALLYRESLRLADYAAAQHALASAGRIMRSSEMGHADYADQLADNAMQQQAETWLRLQVEANRFLGSEPYGTLQVKDESWQGGQAMKLAELAHASFTYQMHHSSGRWSEFGLEDAINAGPIGYLGMLMRELTQTRYQNGTFIGADGEHDLASLAQGLDALHSLNYAWVRWHKPGGSDDMGGLSQERMEQALGISLNELLQMNQALAETLDNYWSDELSAYAENNQADYSLDDFGSLMRGHKGLYEVLYIFGNEQDKANAKQLFERKASMLSALIDSDDVVRDWGVAAAVRFTTDGVQATSDNIDTASQWRLLNHLTGGFATLRENEGTAQFLGEHPELSSLTSSFSDHLLRAAQQYQSGEDGLLVSQLTLADGQITDNSHSMSAIGWYITAAGYAYRTGEAFDRPGAWSEDAELAARSRALYDHILKHNNWLLQQL